MKKIFGTITTYWENLTKSISFFPSLISVGFFVFSLVILSLEYQPFIRNIKDLIQPVLVRSVEDARLILGTLVGSIISLMVFSFSMVMVVLNSTSSTVTPRVLPGLISKKAHQYVLGFYLGTIIFCLILIINIHSFMDTPQVPSFGILLAMLFGITCLILFIYFIDSISRTIQVDYILQDLYKDTLEKIERMKKNMKQLPEKELPDTLDHRLYTHENGYLKKINDTKLVTIASEHDLIIHINASLGTFIVEGYPFLSLNKSISDEVRDDINSCFLFYTEEHIGDHYLFGFKQISEIAVKALSPGINDPGTAIKAIDLLSIMFIKKMRLNDRTYRLDSDGVVRLLWPSIKLEDLLFSTFAPIREYGKSDVTIMIKLLDTLKNLLFAAKKDHSEVEQIRKLINSFVTSCRENIINPMDRDQVNRMIDRVNSTLQDGVVIERLPAIGND